MNTLRQLAARIVRQCAVAIACAFNALCGMQRCCPLCRRTALLFACRPLRRILHKDKAGGFLSGLLSPSVVRAPLLAALRRLGRRILAVLAAVKSGVCAALPAAAFALAALAVQTVAFAPEALANTLCTGKGWTGGPLAGDFVCSIETVDKSSSGISPGGCWMGGTEGRICSNVFGSNANIPQRPSDGSKPTYVFNCDPDGETGLIPATINTIGATSCACPDGQGVRDDNTCGVCPSSQILQDGICAACPAEQGILNGACVACTGGQEVQDGVCACPTAGYELQNGACAPTTEYLCTTSKGWVYDESDDSCAISSESPSGVVSNKCYMSGPLSPQCATIFGSNENIFQYDNSGAGESIDPLVYNCDPQGTSGLLPATINTIRATACKCPLGQELNNGVCAPIQCAEGEKLFVDELQYAGCHDAENVDIAEACRAKDWVALATGDPVVLFCNIPSIRYFASGSSSRENTSCIINPSESSTARNKCRDLFGDPPQFPTATGDSAEDNKPYVTHCNAEGTIPGAIPATINLTGAKECGCDSAAGFVGEYPNCACLTGGSVNANGVCACASGSVVHGGACIPEEGDFGEALSDELLCGAFGGTVRTATGGREVCSGMDANDTFCIMDSAAGFPCRGLFKHLRSCNVQFNRKALNPFFCGEKCGAQKAVGSECR